MEAAEGAGGSLCLAAVPFSKQTQFGVEEVHELIDAIRREQAAGGGAAAGGPGWLPRPARLRAMLASRACRSRWVARAGILVLVLPGSGSELHAPAARRPPLLTHLPATADDKSLHPPTHPPTHPQTSPTSPTYLPPLRPTAAS